MKSGKFKLDPKDKSVTSLPRAVDVLHEDPLNQSAV